MLLKRSTMTRSAQTYESAGMERWLSAPGYTERETAPQTAHPEPRWTIGRAKTATHGPKAGGKGSGGQLKIGVVDGGRLGQPVVCWTAAAYAKEPDDGINRRFRTAPSVERRWIR
jgi:hypothetical protein